MADNEPDLDGITELQFNNWKQHPVSQLFFRYCRHRAENAKEYTVGMWLAGKIELGVSDEARGMINTWNMAGSPDFQVMLEFYAQLQERLQAEEEDQVELPNQENEE